ncbi:MAG: hypothetical protein JEZ07_12245 [Phycisphaerae bacterium]|nr:hypothetical protein [Phycisphaerae bacterium]
MAKKTQNMPLRLEWIEAGTLTENPHNWRKHDQEQLSSIKDLVADPEIGWAGACLFNERTGRLIDGHARRSVVDPSTPIPVLVGDWSEAAELKILATLDPVGDMARGDRDAYGELSSVIDADSLWVRDLIQNTGLTLSSEPEPDLGDSEAVGDENTFPEMELQPFEHYDYVMLMFRDSQDFQQACEKLGIQKVQIKYPGGRRKVGLGRVIDGLKAVKILEGKLDANSNSK